MLQALRIEKFYFFVKNKLIEGSLNNACLLA